MYLLACVLSCLVSHCDSLHLLFHGYLRPPSPLSCVSQPPNQLNGKISQEYYCTHRPTNKWFSQKADIIGQKDKKRQKLKKKNRNQCSLPPNKSIHLDMEDIPLTLSCVISWSLHTFQEKHVFYNSMHAHCTLHTAH
jgi:hypothetical protein